jgi:hypothetical protein
MNEMQHDTQREEKRSEIWIVTKSFAFEFFATQCECYFRSFEYVWNQTIYMVVKNKRKGQNAVYVLYTPLKVDVYTI